MTFQPGFVERVVAAQEVEIETGRSSGETVRTVIWVVVDGGGDQVCWACSQPPGGERVRHGRAHEGQARRGGAPAGDDGRVREAEGPRRPGDDRLPLGRRPERVLPRRRLRLEGGLPR